MVQEAAVAESIPAEAGNVPDASELITPEVIAPVPAEAEAAPTAQVEVPPQPRSIADLSDDELADDPKVKSIIARREQSARDRAAHEAQVRADAELQQYVARGEYQDELDAAYVVDEQTGAVRVDRKRLGDVVGKLQSALATQTSGQAYAALNSLAPFDGLAAEARERIREAGAGWMTAYIDAIADVRAESPERHRKWERTYREQQAARATVAERQAASAARQETGATTGIVGGAAKTFTSQREIDRAHMDGEITTSELKGWRDSGRYAALPF